jgi:hypothetical protein
LRESAEQEDAKAQTDFLIVLENGAEVGKDLVMAGGEVTGSPHRGDDRAQFKSSIVLE